MAPSAPDMKCTGSKALLTNCPSRQWAQQIHKRIKAEFRGGLNKTFMKELCCYAQQKKIYSQTKGAI